MPNYVPTVISYTNNGLVKNKDAFNLTDDSFQVLENVFTRRGRIQRRRGYQTLGRLRRNLTAVAAGNYSTINGTNTFSIFTGLGIAATQPNASIEAGNITAITITFAAPIGQSLTVNTLTSTLTVVGAGPIQSATINYNTGVISITANAVAGPAAVTVTLAYYPSLPVMGLRTRELNALNEEQLVAFDTIYAYQFNNTINLFEEFPATTPTTWNGSNSDFFYTTNYFPETGQNFFWVTNFNKGGTPDPIRYYDSTISDWVTFAPSIDGVGNEMHQARFLIPYRGYFVALNTYEGANLPASTQFPQRARNSQFGDPTAVDAWRSDIAGRGSFIDAPTSEHIISAQFVRDVLIVGFERSTWKLRYTGNRLQPFVWDRINVELGCESSFSTVPFDEGVLQVGDKAITVCDGNSVKPIDLDIPDDVFQIHNGNNGPRRVHGIRDFFFDLVYWTIPIAENNPTFPDRLLIYNYESGAWSYFTDSFTCLGNFQENSDLTWGQAIFSWESANRPWVDPRNQSQFPFIVAGNQQGYVLILNQIVPNQPSLQITAITPGTPVVLTVPDHNLQSGEFVFPSSILDNGSTLNGNIYQINRVDSDNFQLFSYDSINNIFNPVTIGAGTYGGLGQITTVPNFVIRSKKFSFLDAGKQVRVGFLDFLTESTETGEITCRIYVNYEDANSINPQNTNQFFNTTFSTVPDQFSNPAQNKAWHRVYFNTNAQFLAFELTLNPNQITDIDIVNEDVFIDAFIVWASSAGRLVS